MKLREVAFSRSGDKGNVSNVCVFVYRESDWDMVREKLSADVVKEKFSPLVDGEVVRYEFGESHGLNFVMQEALGGGVSVSLHPDPHGKCYQSLILDIDLDVEGDVDGDR